MLPLCSLQSQSQALVKRPENVTDGVNHVLPMHVTISTCKPTLLCKKAKTKTNKKRSWSNAPLQTYTHRRVISSSSSWPIVCTNFTCKVDLKKPKQKAATDKRRSARASNIDSRCTCSSVLPTLTTRAGKYDLRSSRREWCQRLCVWSLMHLISTDWIGRCPRIRVYIGTRCILLG